MALSREDIFSRVKEVMVEALGVDDDEVTESATLSGDLGAESIDYLDIVFRLERDFSIKIPRGELFPDEVLNNPEYVDNGKLTDVGLKKLQEAMPHADLSGFASDPDVARMPEFFTVGTIVNYVERKLAA
ncbi:MAG: acyl carrier protein [Phycisphaerales bacterium]|nr:acyl carrier protein [Phycisphaerales bacterium]